MQDVLAEQPEVSITVAEPNPIGVNPSRRFQTRSPWPLIVAARLLIFGILIAIFVLATSWGLRLRGWAWDQTESIHYFPDINNGLFWGSQAIQPADNPRGFLNVYDVIGRTAPPGDDNLPSYGLDYAPLRLLLMSRWVRWVEKVDPAVVQHAEREHYGEPPGDWTAPYATFAPLLRFNNAMEMVACIGLFFLSRHWVIRGDKRFGSACPAGMWGAIIRPFRGCFAGIIAMLLFWFAPAIILSTHGWPTWDEWIIPFFVWAIYLACIDWWFLAGLVIATGAMFKGQQFFVAPLFVLWPLMLGQWRSALRWVAGLVLGVALIASPWLLTYLPVAAPAGFAGDWPANAGPSDRLIDHAGLAWVIAVAVCLIAAPIVWHGVRRRQGVEQPLNLLAIPTYRVIAALCLGLALLACGLYFSGSYQWMAIGWGFGTRHYPHMTMGVTDNLAGLLDRRFGWRHIEMIAYTFDPHPLRLWPTHTVLFADQTEVTIRAVLIALYVVALLASIIAMAIQSRRNDPNFLIAVVGVWLMFFTLMPQIHERYLIYAAGVGCVLTAVGVGMTLLNIFLMSLTFIMTIHVMLNHAAESGRIANFATGISDTFGSSLLHFCSTTYPDAAWAVMLVAAIFLFTSFRRSPVRMAGVSRIDRFPDISHAFPVVSSATTSSELPPTLSVVEPQPVIPIDSSGETSGESSGDLPGDLAPIG